MSQAVFLSGGLMRHVSVMSLTSSVGILAIFAVDFVDMIFIAMLGQSELAAAIGYAGTILFFTNAIGIGQSIAAGTLVARALGADEVERAREYATVVSVFSIITSILIPILVLPNLAKAIGFLGAEGETLDFAVRYCTIILPTMCFIGLAMTLMAVLRAHGDAKASMFVTLAGGIVNAALDPVLIFGFDLGLDGAAYASVVARFTMGSCAVWYVIKQHNGLAVASINMMMRDMKPVIALSVPAVLTNLATPVGIAIVTREMAKQGTEAVAAMAVIGRLTPMAFAAVLALSGAIGPIIGQNFGAGQYERVRGVLIAGLKFTAIYVIVVSILLVVLRGQIAGLFDATGEMRSLIFLFCGPLALFQFFNGAIFVCNASFNNLGHPLYSTGLNWSLHTVGTLPFILLGSAIAGASGILIGQAAGAFLFAVTGIAIAWRLTGQLKAGHAIDSFAGDKRFQQVANKRSW